MHKTELKEEEKLLVCKQFRSIYSVVIKNEKERSYTCLKDKERETLQELVN